MKKWKVKLGVLEVLEVVAFGGVLLVIGLANSWRAALILLVSVVVLSIVMTLTALFLTWIDARRRRSQLE